MRTPLTGPILGIDIGGTKSAASIASENGELIDREELRSTGGPFDVLEALANAGRELLNAQGTCSLRGVGVSCGGPLDRDRGLIMSPPNLPGWDAIPVRDFFAEEFGVEVRVENDANASALAEYNLGAGSGCSHMAFVTMGTGVGAGLVLNGELFRGKNDLAGEVGHLVYEPNGRLCACGLRGCIEAYASGTGLAQRATEGLRAHPESVLSSVLATTLTARDVIGAARGGDAYATEIVDGAAHAMARAIAALLHTLDLERVILGTLAVHAGAILLDPIRRYAAEMTWPSIANDARIVAAGLGDRVQDYAAISLWLDASVDRG